MDHGLHKFGGLLTPPPSSAREEQLGKVKLEMDHQDDQIVQAIRSELLDVLERLDTLGLAMAGAHLSMAIHCLEPGSFDCAEPAPGNGIG